MMTRTTRRVGRPAGGWTGCLLLLSSLSLCGVRAPGAETREAGAPAPRFARLYEGGFGGRCAKYRIVDSHGVPRPDASPSGEEPSDATPAGNGVDMYNLAMQYSNFDFEMLLEGETLALAFLRTSSPSSRPLARIIHRSGLSRSCEGFCEGIYG